MNKIALYPGLIALSIAGFLAIKANNRVAPANAYYRTTMGNCILLCSGMKFTTVGTCQASIRTSNCNGSTLLYSNSSCSNAAYFKPL